MDVATRCQTASCAFGFFVDFQHWAGAISAFCVADMYLVTRYGRTAIRVSSGHSFQSLFGGHDGMYVQHAEAVGFTCRAFDAFGVVDALAEHLIAAANSQYTPAAT